MYPDPLLILNLSGIKLLKSINNGKYTSDLTSDLILLLLLSLSLSLLSFEFISKLVIDCAKESGVKSVEFIGEISRSVIEFVIEFVSTSDIIFESSEDIILLLMMLFASLIIRSSSDN